MAANVGLDELLGGIARGLVSAQRELNQAALQTSDTAVERRPAPCIFDRSGTSSPAPPWNWS
jgi:hypothetical protein